MNSLRKYARHVALTSGLLLWLGVLWACGTSAPAGGTSHRTAADALAEAAKLYDGRDADLGRVRSAATLARGVLANDANNYEAAWRLSQYSYYLADNTEDKDERSIAFAEGVKAGETAIKLQPDKPEGHFWLGANYGGQARRNPMAGLGLVDKIRAQMNEVIRLDDKYSDGAAYMVLGQVEMQLPTMFGGDPNKAVTYLEKSVNYSKTNVIARYWLAKAYLATDRKADAKTKLEEIMKAEADPNYLAEYKKTQAEAQTLLKEEFSDK